MSIENEISAHGQEPLTAIAAIFERPEIKVLTVGESETFENGIKRFGAPLVNRLATSGLSHFALEASAPTAELLADCIRQNNPDLHGNQFLSSRWYGGESGEADARPDRPFFNTLFAVHEKGISFVGVDETPSGPFKNRDQHMSDRIAEIIESDPNAKVLLWGGYTHHYTRESATGFKTTVEYLRERLGSEAVYAILGWNESDPACFAELKDCPELSLRRAYRNPVARCGGGTCPGPSCIGHSSPPMEQRHMPTFGLYNGLLLLPDADFTSSPLPN